VALKQQVRERSKDVSLSKQLISRLPLDVRLGEGPGEISKYSKLWLLN